MIFLVLPPLFIVLYAIVKLERHIDIKFDHLYKYIEKAKEDEFRRESNRIDQEIKRKLNDPSWIIENYGEGAGFILGELEKEEACKKAEFDRELESRRAAGRRPSEG